MTWIKRMALAILAGVTVSLCANAPASAAVAGQGSAAAGAAVAGTDSNIIAVQREWRGHRGFRGNRGGGRHFGGWRGRRHFGNHGRPRYYGGYGRSRYHGRRSRGFRFYATPLIGAPFLFGSYGYSRSCYRVCRAYHGRRYCQRHWRRYC